MKNLLICSLFIGVALLGCDKDPTKQETPEISECLEIWTDAITNQPLDCTYTYPADIYSYIYQGELVYYIPIFCCCADTFDSVLDENCVPVCAPSGGFSGGGDGKCPDFFDVATDKTLVWEDPR